MSCQILASMYVFKGLINQDISFDKNLISSSDEKTSQQG